MYCVEVRKQLAGYLPCEPLWTCIVGEFVEVSSSKLPVEVVSSGGLPIVIAHTSQSTPQATHSCSHTVDLENFVVQVMGYPLINSIGAKV